ncbi:hypothetical protein [Thalassobacillus sp. C254]|uniref:hypothetical protein n=1 Tax=Thalassobacillus sp. C254 TaxID=1225341 RepID=UPI0006D19CA6|nr:hypothetical protein [Thalassobacillus sp. C254]
MSEERKELLFLYGARVYRSFSYGSCHNEIYSCVTRWAGQVISVFGFLLIVAYIKHMEKRLSIRKKVIVLTNIIFTAGFSIVSFVLYF